MLTTTDAEPSLPWRLEASEPTGVTVRRRRGYGRAAKRSIRSTWPETISTSREVIFVWAVA